MNWPLARSLLGERARSKAVGVQFARLGVEGFFECGSVDAKVARKAELRKVVVLRVVGHGSP